MRLLTSFENGSFYRIHLLCGPQLGGRFITLSNHQSVRLTDLHLVCNLKNVVFREIEVGHRFTVAYAKFLD